jgi:DNA-binding NarL/FixJ family response regulator
LRAHKIWVFFYLCREFIQLIPMEYKVALADKQFLTHEGIKLQIQKYPNFVLVGSVFTIIDLIYLLKNQILDLLLLDYTLFAEDNFSNLKSIRHTYPDLAIVIITNQTYKNDIKELSKLNIKNIIYKNTDSEELFVACTAALNKKSFYAEEVLELLVNERSGSLTSETQVLTASEVEIVKKIAAGLTTKEIADQKNISIHTVMTHRKNIFRKIGINNSSELLMFAVRTGMIDSIDYVI